MIYKLIPTATNNNSIIAYLFRDNNLLNGYKLNVIYDRNLSDTQCIKNVPIRSLLDEVNRYQPTGYVGYKCNCRTIAKILGATNYPLISHVSLFYIYFRDPFLTGTIRWLILAS